MNSIRLFVASILLFAGLAIGAVAPDQNKTGIVTTTPTFTSLTVTGGTVTTSTPTVSATQTWNNVATTFTGWLMNITDTASAAGSLLMDLRVGGASLAQVQKSGTFRSAAGYTLAQNGAAITGNRSAILFDTGGGGNLYMTGLLGWSAFGTDAGSVDLFLARDAANTLAQRNGTSAQTFRLYNTYTDASNYERVAIVASAGNAYSMYSQAAGTGTVRALNFGVNGGTQWGISTSGHWLALTDNTYDIGASGATRPRNLYVAGTGTFGGIVSAAAFTSSDYVGLGRLLFTGVGQFKAESDGVFSMRNAALNDFGRLQFGGTTSSFPAIKRNGTALNFRLADDSADAPITAAAGTFTGTVTATSSVATGTTTVGSLTACSGALKGARHFVTDANATTFLSAVAAGGANNVPVVCDGTNWVIG